MLNLSRYKEPKLVTITRQDISPGYQVVQTAHAVADFCTKAGFVDVTNWMRKSGSIISLSVKNEKELLKWVKKLKRSVRVYEFREPDVGNQLTAICFYAQEKTRKKIKNLPLALKELSPKIPVSLKESALRNLIPFIR